MDRVVEAVNEHGQKRQVEAREWPDTCPLCHHGIEPIVMMAYLTERELLQVVYRCPRNSCNRVFVGCFIENASRWVIYFIEPYQDKAPSLPEGIKEVSPDFVSIFTEATIADQRNLRHVAGPGYRKALEFLVKDYLIAKRPDQKDAIAAARLGVCIQNYVDEPNVQLAAKRAAWLGNDETHYTREWEGKKIDDLRRLIQLTVYWVAMERETEALLQEMPEKPRSRQS
jgi:hypothetical protein